MRRATWRISINCSADLQVGCPVGLQTHRHRLAAWTPPAQPISHPCEHKPLAGDPGLEIGATFLSQFTDTSLRKSGSFRAALSSMINREFWISAPKANETKWDLLKKIAPSKFLESVYRP
jgi:hypothetical protein